MRAHLASLVEDFRHHADETAVVAHRGVRRYRTNYEQLAQLTGRFAAELERLGIEPGERVVLWGANSAEWIAVFFGCILRGVIAVPLDAAGSVEFAQRVVRDVSPRLIVGDRDPLCRLAKADGKTQCMLFSELEAKLPREANFAVSPAVNADSAFQIVFTSGTTSEPKGIVHTHANVLASVAPIEREMAKYLKYERIFHPLRFLVTLPLSHVFGQFMGLWLPPLLAAEVHFAEQLEARRMTELIRREKISVLVAVPRVLQLLRAQLLSRFEGLAEKIEGSNKRTLLKQWWKFREVHHALGWKFWAVISGGAALPVEIEQFWNRLGVALIQGYGMTETTALVTLNHPFKIGQGTIGKTLPGREVRLSEDGEILVRGESLAAATWQAGQVRRRDGEWLATGDLAAENDAGELRFLGRKGDLIVTSGGMNVHPGDLEEAMKRQPGVRDCVVVPCQTSAGPEPVAVVLGTGSGQQWHEMVVEANRELADYQQIRRVLHWPEAQFPFTSTGKLLRRKVAEWACFAIQNQQQNGRRPGQHSAQTGAEILLEVIAEVTGESVPGTEDALRLSEDFHLDSLGRVQLQTALEERLGLELQDDALAAVATLGELRAIVAAQTAGEAPARREPSEESFESALAAPEPRGENSGTMPAAPPLKSGEEMYRSEHFYPKWPWSWPLALGRAAFLELIVRPLMRLLAAPRVVSRGGELAAGPVLVIANHVSAYDGAMVLYALPGKLRRRLAIAMSGEMLLDLRRGRNQSPALLNLVAPLQYWLATALFNVYPLPRLHGFRRSFAHAGEAMDRGFSVLVFPEGARHDDGTLHAFRSGIGLLAQETRATVVPVALVGLDEMKKSGWFRSGRLEIRVGEPAPFDEELDPAERTKRLEEALRHLLA